MQMIKVETRHLLPNHDEHLGHFRRLRVLIVGERSYRLLECRRPLLHGSKELVQATEIFRERRKLRKVLVHLRPLLGVFM